MPAFSSVSFQHPSPFFRNIWLRWQVLASLGLATLVTENKTLSVSETVWPRTTKFCSGTRRTVAKCNNTSTPLLARNFQNELAHGWSCKFKPWEGRAYCIPTCVISGKPFGQSLNNQHLAAWAPRSSKPLNVALGISRRPAAAITWRVKPDLEKHDWKPRII